MRTALYGEQGRSPELDAFAAGWGKTVWRHPHFWHGEVMPFDLVVLGSLWANNAAILRAYSARGVPALVIDLGYIRGRGHWQVSLGGLNRIVPFACPQDRWDALGVSVAASGGDPNGYTLIAGQRPQDASHGLSVGEYNAWLAKQHGRVRLHPREAEPERSLAEDLAGAKVVRTLCSTAGLDALIAGVPAIAEMPERAIWGELSGPKLPSMAERLAVFSRIAYGQWTLDEMRSGECAAFVRDHLLPNVPMPMPEQPRKRGRPRKVKHDDHR